MHDADMELKKAEYRDTLRLMRGMWQEEAEHIDFQAKTCYHYFECLVNHGFSTEQALSIVKEHGIYPKDVDWNFADDYEDE